ncbi:hypothetical protein P7C70_g8410, partial [Phenoliferia sp. Uapishka_3]
MSGPLEYVSPESQPLPQKQHDLASAQERLAPTPAEAAEERMQLQNSNASSSLPTPPAFHDTPASVHHHAQVVSVSPTSDLRTAVAPTSQAEAVSGAPVAVDYDAVVGGGDAIDGGMDAELADALNPGVPLGGSSVISPPPPQTNGVNGHSETAPERLPSPVAPAEAQAIAESLPLSSIATPKEGSPVSADVVSSTDQPAPIPPAPAPLSVPSAIPPP